MKIADNILAYIRANGIQQKILVDKCGWSKQKVYSMLHGINRISIEEYGMICKALCVPFNFRVALGRMSELGYSMMFGETKKEFFFKNIKGRGYADTGKGVITEFYTPIVPKGYDFLQEIGRCYCVNNQQ